MSTGDTLTSGWVEEFIAVFIYQIADRIDFRKTALALNGIFGRFICNCFAKHLIAHYFEAAAPLTINTDEKSHNISPKP
jgi:hypothetical protein